VGVRDRLFHTLDPTTRSFEIGGRTYLLTDTVGFIRKLPHALVDAFSATLEEAMGADLIVHVADASVPEDDLHEMLSAVDDVLGEIGAGDRPRLLALNKADLLDEERRRALSFRFPQAVQVSSVTGDGLDELREAIEARFLATLRPMDLLLPYEEGGTLSELHDLAGELERTDTAEGVRVKARVPAAAAPRFERFEQNGRG
jgi:GTPase